jgi:hypothetical protein
MSSIEERLARDIAAVTGGVVVTESDLKDAREAVDERIDSSQRRRRRLALGAAVAAVVVPIVAVTAVGVLGDPESATPVSPVPTDPVPTNPDAADPDTAEAFLTGSAPTPALLQGVWRRDDEVNLLVRFSSPNLIWFDGTGLLFKNPAVHGTYVIEGDQIIVSVDGGPADCGGQTFTMRASLPEPGALRFVHTQPGTGNCASEPNEEWVLEQVLPTNAGLAGVNVVPEGGWSGVTDSGALLGDWMAEGGGHILEVDADGSYYVADDSGEPVDQGRWSLQASELTLTSAAASDTCRAGDRLILGALEQQTMTVPALRGTVAENACGGAWVPELWMQLTP